jgi:uncharacterized damage-inducible protein DinB
VLILPEYCVTMARYNAWQNKQLRAAFATLSDAELRKDRKAFFGSLMKTANHVLWGDTLWMSRFDGGPRPAVEASHHAELAPTPAVWAGERFKMDARILKWADHLKAIDLKADLTWYSGTLEQDVSKPLDHCIVQFFNHQTHHRGQIHAMLTAAGATAPVSDLVFMPEHGPWL